MGKNFSFFGKKKLKLWKRKMNDVTSKDFFSTYCTNFPLLTSVPRYEINFWKSLIIKTWLEKFFQKKRFDKFTWVSNSIEENFLQIVWRQNLAVLEFIKFFNSITDDSLLNDKSSTLLILYFNEADTNEKYSAVTVIKSKYRTKINAEKETKWLCLVWF